MSHSMHSRNSSDDGSRDDGPPETDLRASSASTSSLSSRRTTASAVVHSQVMSSALTRKLAKPFTSQLLPEDESGVVLPLPKPWLGVKDPRIRVSWWITVGISLLGVLLSAFLVFNGWRTLPRVGNLCLVMEDQFDSSTLDTSIWTREVDLGGFGNGEFEMTTDADANSYIKNGILYIQPTLTSDSIGRAAVLDGHIFNLTGCTAANTPQNLTSCSAVSNATAGTAINPVMSARLHTRGTRSIKYGRVEIRAKMPRGNWLWPALWMLPVNNTYGPWPASGEIDIVESRGNEMNYPAKGRNYAIGTLHWGPTANLDLGWKTTGYWFFRRYGFDQGFHTYALEWNEDFIWTYVDTRLHRMLDTEHLGGSKGSFWSRGKFPSTLHNGSETTLLSNPWAGRGPNAPFDQQFYLIMNVAVGGTNGYFPDNVGGKLWLDGSTRAMYDFASKQDNWTAQWPANVEDRAMQIDYVKMWQRC